jgi:hypothetical protein
MSSLVIRQALVPMLVFFIAIMVVLAAGLRMSRRQSPGTLPEEQRRQAAAALWPHSLRPLAGRGPGWLRVVAQYLYTALGGYLLLILVVLIYYFGVARVGGDFIESAVTGCALLLGLSAPVFLVVSWLAKRRT